MTETTQVRSIPPGRPETRGWAVLAQLPHYGRDPMALFEQQWTTYGAVSPLRILGGDRWVLLLGPDKQEAVLTHRDTSFADGPAWSRLVGPFFHGGLMLLDFDENHLHRRILQQAFTRDRLEGHTERVDPAYTVPLDHHSLPFPSDGQPVDLHPLGVKP